MTRGMARPHLYFRWPSEHTPVLDRGCRARLSSEPKRVRVPPPIPCVWIAVRGASPFARLCRARLEFGLIGLATRKELEAAPPLAKARGRAASTQVLERSAP